MTTRVYRDFTEPDREGLSWEERWKGPDRGLISCWEAGRRRRSSEPDLVAKVMRGELPPLAWKGGVKKKLKTRLKTGTLFYLALLQGLRGEDLDIDLESEPEMTCSRTKQTVVFTGDYEKYKNA